MVKKVNGADDLAGKFGENTIIASDKKPVKKRYKGSTKSSLCSFISLFL